MISKVNYRYRNIYARRLKAYNALIIQLKIKIIKFDQFLYERRILDVLIAHCSCDNDHMTMKHILFFCLNWKKERKKKDAAKN